MVNPFNVPFLFKIIVTYFRFTKRDFQTHNINIENAVTYHNQVCPFSTVLINEKNGSRTIIHSNKNMPELKLSDFRKLDLNQYSWIHFEV